MFSKIIVKTKGNQFDGIRAVAMLCIVACHLSYGIHAMSPVGQYLGGTFNFVFFLLSALLIGESVNKRKVLRGGYLDRSQFLKKRFIRIVPDLWIFLTVYFLVTVISGQTVDYKAFAMNYAMLGWFKKLPYCGHLWFVTMIMLCYVLFASLFHITNKKKALILLLAVCSIGQALLWYLHLPAYMFLILFATGVFMMFSGGIVRMMDKTSFTGSLIAAVISNISYFMLIDSNCLIIGHIDYYYAACLCGITMLIFLYKLFRILPVGKPLALVSVLSYQIYLIHHPLCNVNYIALITGGRVTAIILILAVISALAYILYRLSNSEFIISLLRKTEKTES